MKYTRDASMQPASGIPTLPHVVRLPDHTTELVNESKLELPSKPKELTESAQECRQRLLASLPRVGMEGTVVCLCCKQYVASDIWRAVVRS